MQRFSRLAPCASLLLAVTSCVIGEIDAPASTTLGTQGTPCYANGTCDAELVCSSNNTCEVGDRCAGISCNGHGQCVVVASSPECDCDAGYHQQGLNCIADDSTCVDNDDDGYGAGCVDGLDCDDDDGAIYQWLTGYPDADGDQHGDGAAQQVCSGDELPVGMAPISGDCDPRDPEVWQGCLGCTDNDGDGHGAGCPAGTDCDDANTDVWLSCDSCDDVDSDGYFAGCDSYIEVGGPDCNDASGAHWDDCLTCTDSDGDDHGVGCNLGADCDDNDRTIFTACPIDPCIGVTCSGHGACQVSAETAVCHCDDGYVPDGLSCVPEPVDPCVGQTCSNHGTCQATGPTAICICDTGYVSSGLSCVVGTAFSFVVFGDMNGGGCGRNDRVERIVNQMAQEENTAFYVSTGDLIDGYPASGGGTNCFATDPGDACTPQGNMATLLSPIKDRLPVDGLVSSFYPTIGNHDDNWGSGWYPDPCGGGICGLLSPLTPGDFINHAYGDICSLNEGSSSHSEDFYYSFAHQNSYFIILRLNNDYSPIGAAQMTWLEDELVAAEASYDHVFVFAHVPLLGSGDNHGPVEGAAPVRALLEQHNVDAYFNGHNHAYERTHPVRGSVIDPTGTTYITTGVAGASVDDAMGDWFTAATYREWTTWGNLEGNAAYIKVTVDGDSVTAEVFSLAFGSTVVDSFTIGSGSAPCAGITCNGHGTCSGGVCTCDVGWAEPDCASCGSGYRPEGGACVPDNDPGTGNAQPGTGAPQADAVVRTLGGCQIFPGNNFWNVAIDQLPRHPYADDYEAFISSMTMHPDFGGYNYGIPFDVVVQSQAPQIVRMDYLDESDCFWGPSYPSPIERACVDKATGVVLEPVPNVYPIPSNPSIEGGIDDHIILVQQETCMLFEIFAARKEGTTWHGGSGAIWDLSKNERRDYGDTSADAAGLPILPGLVLFDEVFLQWDASAARDHTYGEINHAIRVTLENPQSAYLLPGSHSDGNQGGGCAFGDAADPSPCPPMALKFRLRGDFDISSFSLANQVILRALKTYGMVVADTGGDLYISGDNDDRWEDASVDLGALNTIPGSAFEAVDTNKPLCPYQSSQFSAPTDCFVP